MSNLMVHNKLTEEVWAHPEIALANEQGDIEKAKAIMAKLTDQDGHIDRKDFVRIDSYEHHNINVLEGKIAALNLIAARIANSTLTWHFAPYTDTGGGAPADNWTGDFVANGITEYTDYQGTNPSGGRQRIVFDDATGSGSQAEITNTQRAVLDVGNGGTINGVCVLDGSTKGSNADTLLAAVQYGAPKTYGVGDVRYLGYKIYIP